MEGGGNQKGGQFNWDASKVSLYLSDAQKSGKCIEGNKLREELAGKPVLNANVLDICLPIRTHPEEWKDKYVFFWGTIYRHLDGSLCVRCLCWTDLNGGALRLACPRLTSPQPRCGTHVRTRSLVPSGGQFQGRRASNGVPHRDGFCIILSDLAAQSDKSVSRETFCTIGAENLTRPKTAAPLRSCKIDRSLVHLTWGGSGSTDGQLGSCPGISFVRINGSKPGIFAPELRTKNPVISMAKFACRILDFVRQASHLQGTIRYRHYM